MKEKFSRWEILCWQYLKRDWKKIVLWVIGLGLFSAGFIPAFKEIAKDQGLIGMFETLQNPAMISMVGPTPIEHATDYTLGAMYTHEMLLFCSLFAMILSILHVIGHTRKEEDLGLSELVRSFQIGRQANSFAVMIESLLINGLLALLISIGMMSFNADTISTQGALLFGTSVGMAGMIGAAIALVVAQIMPTSSSATGSTLGIVGLLYILRAGTDVANENYSMMNPLGWTYLTFPFTNNDWLPIIYAVIFSLLMLLLAIYLEGNRDMGAGYLPQREGRANARASLLSVQGLFLKINKGVIISWLLAFVIMGAAYGSIYGDMQAFLESNEMMKQMFAHTSFSIEKSFTSTIMIVMVGLVSILPIVIVNKLYTEENRLHLSQIYATKITRARLYWTTLGIAMIAGIIGVILAAASLGGTAISVMNTNSEMNLEDFMMAGFNLFPSVLFFIGLAALALGWAPRLGKTVYIYLTFSFLLNYFSGLIELPDWFLKLAIQSWIPQMPMDDFNVTIFIALTVISIALMLLGYLGYKRRDLLEGA